jgi:zinc transporter 12
MLFFFYFQLPELMHMKTKQKWKIFFFQNLGLVIGFIGMVLIAVYEDHISFGDI